MAVPQLRRAPRIRDAAGQNFAGRADDARRITSHQTIGALLYGDRAFGVIAQRQAWDAERRRLLLQAAGIGQRQPRITPQPQEIQVTERGDYADAGWRAEAEFAHPRPRARMGGKDDRQFARYFADRGPDSSQ